MFERPFTRTLQFTRLNLRLQSAVPGLLLFGVQPYFAFVASEDNCADDPTRRVPLQGSKHRKPPWLVAAEAGHFELLDAFLAEQSLDPLKLQGLTELEFSFISRAEPDPGCRSLEKRKLFFFARASNEC